VANIARIYEPNLAFFPYTQFYFVVSFRQPSGRFSCCSHLNDRDPRDSSLRRRLRSAQNSRLEKTVSLLDQQWHKRVLNHALATAWPPPQSQRHGSQAAVPQTRLRKLPVWLAFLEFLRASLKSGQSAAIGHTR
jgi:hypothetical protein